MTNGKSPLTTPHGSLCLESFEQPNFDKCGACGAEANQYVYWNLTSGWSCLACGRELQHPATQGVWAWLDENRDNMEPERIDRIEATLRAISTAFWQWDREAGRV